MSRTVRKSIDKTAGTLETARQLLGILIDTALKEHVFDRMKKPLC